MARQYFDSMTGESTLSAISITPTTTKTFLFTQAQASQFLALPYGVNALSMPYTGQIFNVNMGGLLTTPATGTLVIDPVHGIGTSSTAGGTDLGASAAQTVTVSLSSVPWYLTGFLTYRSISAAATSSTAWFTGSFESQGTLATAGGGFGIIMGSTAAVSVDTTGAGSAGTFGGLNFYVTFSVTGGTISCQWCNIRSLN